MAAGMRQGGLHFPLTRSLRQAIRVNVWFQDAVPCTRKLPGEIPSVRVASEAMRAIREHGMPPVYLVETFVCVEVNVKDSQRSTSELRVLPFGREHGASLSEWLAGCARKSSLYILQTGVHRTPEAKVHKGQR